MANRTIRLFSLVDCGECGTPACRAHGVDDGSSGPFDSDDRQRANS